MPELRLVGSTGAQSGPSPEQMQLDEEEPMIVIDGEGDNDSSEPHVPPVGGSGPSSGSGETELDAAGEAQRVLREHEEIYGDGDAPPVPVEDIAESHLGLLIVECDDVRALEGAPRDRGRLSGMLDPDRERIWLDRTECRRSRGRRRFTVAHECGHWVLHVIGAQGGVLIVPDEAADTPMSPARKKLIARQEREANAFASELLMPELLVREQARASGCNLPALAERFDVSVPAIRHRVLTLGLLPAWMRSVPVAGKERR